MIKIYCLINPLTGIPFYVGATRRTLHARFVSHVGASNVKTYSITKSSTRANLIKSLMSQGLKPHISCLMIVSPDVADYCESHFYNYFISQGIDLLQSPHRFTYQQHYCKNKS